jgi:hypothetical protein
MTAGTGPFSASGTKLWLGTTASNGATDTYTQIGSLESLGSYGIQFAENVFEDLSQGIELTFKGIRKDGAIAVGLGYDVSDSGQAALNTALLDTSPSDYNMKVTYADAVAAANATVTVTIAAPGVFTDTAHGLAANTPVSFATTGALPTGLVAGTTYYVKSPTTDAYSVSATAGGSAITTTGTQSGVQTRSTVPAGTYHLMKGKVMSQDFTPGTLSTVVKSTLSLKIKSGTLAVTNRIPTGV